MLEATGSGTQEGASEDVAVETAALARLVAYAAQSARGLGLETSAYMLEIALAAVLEDLHGAGTPFAGDLRGARPN